MIFTMMEGDHNLLNIGNSNVPLYLLCAQCKHRVSSNENLTHD